jgi:hypothetical protein
MRWVLRCALVCALLFGVVWGWPRVVAYREQRATKRTREFLQRMNLKRFELSNVTIEQAIKHLEKAVGARRLEKERVTFRLMQPGEDGAGLRRRIKLVVETLPDGKTRLVETIAPQKEPGDGTISLSLPQQQQSEYRWHPFGDAASLRRAVEAIATSANLSVWIKGREVRFYPGDVAVGPFVRRRFSEENRGWSSPRAVLLADGRLDLRGVMQEKGFRFYEGARLDYSPEKSELETYLPQREDEIISSRFALSDDERRMAWARVRDAWREMLRRN